MSTHYITDLLHVGRRTELFLLAFFSCAGAVLGVTIAYASDPFMFSLMRMAASDHVSIVGLVLVTLFPFLVTAIAFYLSKPYLFFPISFFKTFSYTLAMCCVCIEFLHAGWLVCMFLLFSDTFAMIALHWYWIRHIDGFHGSAKKDLFFCLAVSLCICFVDYIWVSPFLLTLMND